MSGRRLYWRGMVACIVIGERRAMGTDRYTRPDRARPGRGLDAAIQALSRVFSSRIEVADAACLVVDLSREQGRFTGPEAMASGIRECIAEATGLDVSIGLAADRTSARLAACLPGADGRTRIVPPWQARRFLQWLPIADVLDPGPALKAFLDEQGVVYCGQMRHVSMDDMRRRFGRHGARLWLASQGRDPGPVATPASLPEVIGLGKLLPPATRDPRIIESALEHIAARLAERLRDLGLRAQGLEITLETPVGPLRSVQGFERPSAGHETLVASCRTALRHAWDGQTVTGVHLRTRGSLAPRRPAGAGTRGSASGADRHCR